MEQSEINEDVTAALNDLNGRLIKLEIIEEAVRGMIMDIATAAGMTAEQISDMLKTRFAEVDHPQASVQYVDDVAAVREVLDALKEAVGETLQ